MRDLILASGSPRRHKIMRSLGCSFSVVVPEVEEICDGSDPVRTVVSNASAKLRACCALYPEAVVIAADTLVWFEGRLIGKPVDLQQAAEFLREFSGRSQLVFTALAMAMPGGEPAIRVESSSVLFKELSEAVIADYLAGANPLDRAGAYDIDEHEELFVAGYYGSRSNIMGMPVGPVRDWLRSNGVLS